MDRSGMRSRRCTAAVLLAMLITGVGVWWFSRPDSMPRILNPETPISTDPERTRWEQTGLSLHDIRLGLPRSEVEGLLGAPEPLNVDAVSPEKRTYCTRYLVYLHRPLALVPNIEGFCEAQLTFDATQAGHPLVHITCTPRKLPSPRVSTANAIDQKV